MPRKQSPSASRGKKAEIVDPQANPLKAPELQAVKQRFLERQASLPNALKTTKNDNGGYECKPAYDGKNGYAELWVRMFAATGVMDRDAQARLFSQLMLVTGEAHQDAAFALLGELEPQTPLEGVLCSQMVAINAMAMEFSKRAMMTGVGMEHIDRNTNRAAKLFGVFARQAEVLQRLRTGGQQRIQVQHVHVNGGQAIVGDVTHQQGGGGV
jgi:hypothetical protein